MKPGQLNTDSRHQSNPSRVYGLTGGIAAGKSLVAKVFTEEGIPVIDADKIALELSQKGGKAEKAILQRFGTMDRSKLRKIVFSDQNAKRDLEAILHPLIRAETLLRIGNLASEKLVIYEAALLVETGRYKDLDGLILVEAPEDLRKSRLMERDKIDDELATQMIANQATDDEKRKLATFVLVNDGDPETLKIQVRKLIKQITQP